MRNLKATIVILALALSGIGTPVATAAAANPLPTQATPSGAEALSRPSSEGGLDRSGPASYGSREESSKDLEQFTGGGQVVLFTEYDFQIFMTAMLITAVVILVILL